ncbi:MAG: hypothetical protein ACRCYC_12110 [Paraclostridium sp.]|uniref:hypothetical protein n=1 Tax=Paraclostridium sp. TaxID=2023273 RepID=UPI003F3FCAF5
MSFNDTDILIKDSKEELKIFKLGSSIIYQVIKKNSNEVYTDEIIKGELSFIDIYMDIDKNDNIYGIVNDKIGKICSINVEDDIKIETIFKYDYKNFHIKFPYIKNLSNENHIIYQSINKKTPLISNLIHIYKQNNQIFKNNIDYIPYNIMSNFEVVWKKDIPALFYFKSIKGFEELFVSTFNKNYCKWSKPLKITNSKEFKIYLSALVDSNGNYHVVFAENNDGKYYCKYLRLSLEYNNIEVLESKIIKTQTMCLFPHLINYKNTLYIQWGEYHYIYGCKSIDLGKTWDEPTMRIKESESDFKRYMYKSNYIEEKEYKFSTVFANKENIKQGKYKIKDSF